MRTFFFRLALAGLLASLVLVVFFYGKVRERDRYLTQLIGSVEVDSSAPATDAAIPASDVAIALSQEIYRQTNREVTRSDLDWYDRWESTSPFNMTSGTSLRYGAYSIRGHSAEGACGTMSRTLLDALWRMGIPARKLQLLDNAEGVGGGHTLVEVEDRGRWIVIAPSDSTFVWRNADGEPATIDDIRRDEDIYAQVFRWKSDYPYRFDNPSHIRWEKLPPPMRAIFRTLLGKSRYHQALTPKLYDTPRTLFLIVSWVLVVAFGLLAFLLRPRAKIASHAANP